MGPGPFGAAEQPSAPPYGQPPAEAGAGAFGQPPAEAGAGTSPLAGFGAEQFAATGGQAVAIAASDGYIDTAIIRSRFRIRYDTAYNLNSPDRAEFFYPKCGCFSMLPRSDPRFDPRALGPAHRTLTPEQAILRGRPGLAFPGEARIDFQEVAPYLEYAANPRFAGFIEMPARFLNATLGRNTYGWSDLNLGFKYAFIANPNQFYTFQFRTYVPTGSGEKGLGTNHASLEPGFLVFQRLSDRLYFTGQFRDWIPVHATNFAGNILIYGAGFFYNFVLTPNFRVAPVNEFVGWTMLSGKELVPDPQSPATMFGAIKDVAGQTIVNYKIGLRFALGNYNQAGGGSALNDRHSLYVGYGQALTGEHWYQNMFRLEYDFWF